MLKGRYRVVAGHRGPVPVYHKVKLIRSKIMSDEKALARAGGPLEVVYESDDGLEVKLTPELVRKFLVKGHAEYITVQEILYYAHLCRSLRMNPFTQDCYLIKYTREEPAAVVQSIEFIRHRARQARDCTGWRVGILYLDLEGNLKESNGYLPKDCELVGSFFEAQPTGWTTVYRKEFNLNRYVKKTREGRLTKFWEPSNQPEMMMKVAESQGLRALWPKAVGRVYIQEEMDLGLTEIDKRTAIEAERAIEQQQSANLTSEDLEEKRREFMRIHGITNDEMFLRFENDTAAANNLTLDAFRKYYLIELDDQAKVVGPYKEYVLAERRRMEALRKGSTRQPPSEKASTSTSDQKDAPLPRRKLRSEIMAEIKMVAATKYPEVPWDRISWWILEQTTVPYEKLDWDQASMILEKLTSGDVEGLLDSTQTEPQQELDSPDPEEEP